LQVNLESCLFGELILLIYGRLLFIELNLCTEETGVLLCGDFFDLAGKYGGMGEV